MYGCCCWLANYMAARGTPLGLAVGQRQAVTATAVALPDAQTYGTPSQRPVVQVVSTCQGRGCCGALLGLRNVLQSNFTSSVNSPEAPILYFNWTLLNHNDL